MCYLLKGLAMEDQTLKIEGTVENVLFRNDSNGYTVLDIDTGGELVTAVGELGDVESGEILIIEGIYVTHPKFGVQFKAEYCERKLPNTSVNICKYLSSGAIKGIGPALAQKLSTYSANRLLKLWKRIPGVSLKSKAYPPKMRRHCQRGSKNI